MPFLRKSMASSPESGRAPQSAEGPRAVSDSSQVAVGPEAVASAKASYLVRV
jgi:hypothetical protein